jgi:putative GTP pyrophosphokinase
VVEIIEKRTDMEILRYKDYISNQKNSGYRSYHVVVKYSVQTKEGPKTVKVEIQIRTLAMNFWAVIEHSLQYKYHEHMPDHIRARLSAASDAIIQLDNEMSQIRDEIMDTQNSMRKKDMVVGEILNLIHNLYQTANKREVLKIQEEFYRVYQKNDMGLLNHFLEDLDTIAESYRAQNIDGLI